MNLKYIRKHSQSNNVKNNTSSISECFTYNITREFFH